MYSALIGFSGALVGLAIGVAGGRLLSAFLTDLTGLQLPALAVRPLEVVLAFGVGLCVTVGATLIPATRSAGGLPARLLHAPGIQSEYRRRHLARLVAPIARLNRSIGLGLQNVLRRPGRTALTVTVVTVAVAAFVSTQALSDSVSGTADDLYELYGADGWIFFGGGADTSIARALRSEPAVADAEPWTTAGAAMSGACPTSILCISTGSWKATG
jgi:hypothetical protein